MERVFLKRNVAISLVASMLIVGAVIFLAIISIWYSSQPAIYFLENPDLELVSLIEDEFKIKIPDNTNIERVTLDNSKDNIATLTFSGLFSVDNFLKNNIEFLVGEIIEQSENMVVYTISGFNSYADVYAEMRITEDGDSYKTVIIKKRGITNQKLEETLINR